MREVFVFILVVGLLFEGWKIRKQNEDLDAMRSHLTAQTPPPASLVERSNWIDARIANRDHPLDAKPYDQKQAVIGVVPPTQVMVNQNGLVH